jgi:metal-responsive CopG/Arc/MetJ family transcriptional regulator
MKTAVSLPDDVFAQAETYARSKHLSRSRLYAAALREYLARHDDDAVTTAIDAVCAEVSTELEPDLAEAARRTLLRNQW